MKLISFLIALIALTSTSELIAQENKSEDLKDFKIVIEKTPTGIKMQSIKGSAWLCLTYSNNNILQAIDQFGMTELNSPSSDKDSNLADFLFTITKSERGIVLKGIKGTAWTDLSFTLDENGKQAIDQFGMAD
jgi:hypothetical protein